MLKTLWFLDCKMMPTRRLPNWRMMRPMRWKQHSTRFPTWRRSSWVAKWQGWPSTTWRRMSQIMSRTTWIRPTIPHSRVASRPSRTGSRRHGAVRLASRLSLVTMRTTLHSSNRTARTIVSPSTNSGMPHAHQVMKVTTWVTHRSWTEWAQLVIELTISVFASSLAINRSPSSNQRLRIALASLSRTLQSNCLQATNLKRSLHTTP